MIDKEAVEEEIKRLDSRIIALEQDIKISRAEKRACSRKRLELKQLLWKYGGEDGQ